MFKLLRSLWLSTVFWGVFVFISPAEAARLTAWQFEPNRNQLTFSTDEGVRPAIQVISNPTRLVIDLPGTSRGNVARSQFIGGLVREVRIGQLDSQTTRIVVELDQGYTINPQQIRFLDVGNNQWVVQLPTPQIIGQPRPFSNQPLPPLASEVTSPVLNSAVQFTQSGIFLSNIVGDPQIRSRRSNDRRTIEFEVEGAGLPPGLAGQSFGINRYGINQIQVEQIRDSLFWLRLQVEANAPDWQAIYNSQAQAILLVPVGVSMAELDQGLPSSLATIQGLDLSGERTQLFIRSDRAIQPTTSFDRDRNLQIIIPNARVVNPLPQPSWGANSPILRVQAAQRDAQTVVITLQPALGARFGQISQLSNQLAVLQIFPQEAPVVTPGIDLPPVRGRVMVVIDPGHGGRDPGAIGIGGLRESEIVLDISQQLSQFLEQQGLITRMTRTSDEEVDLAPRVDLANRMNADLFVSVHANAISLSRPDVNGLETYYFSSGQELAGYIHRSVLQSIPEMRDRRIRRANFYVLRNTQMPAVLVEVGFVTGDEDSRRLSEPEFRRRMALAIARGILLYLQQR